MILDTDVLIALLNGEKDANQAMQSLEEKGERIATTIISAYELLKGTYISARPERNLTKAQDLLSNLEILDLTLQACQEASVIYREMRRAGCLIGEFDMLIAAIARTCNETIMTRDEHFSKIQSTKVAGW